MLGHDVVLVHACALEPDDIALMRGTGTSVVHCPTGPAKMGSGVTPVHLLHSAGINITLGTDAAAANNGADLIATSSGSATCRSCSTRSDRVDL